VSAFGPALVVSRTDGTDTPPDEQAEILTRIRSVTARPGPPRSYGYEPLAPGCAATPNTPDEVREDRDKA
jgi:hypothetical protein